MKKPTILISSVVLALVGLAYTSPVSAGAIIYDTFTNTTGHNIDLSDHTNIDTNLPGGAYLIGNHSARGNMLDTSSGVVLSYDSDAAFLPITSAGTYTEPTGTGIPGTVAVSADLAIGSLTGTEPGNPANAKPAPGILIGFLVGPPNTDISQGAGVANIAGILIAPNGDVYADASVNNAYAGRDLTFLGVAPAGFSAADGYHLSYDVNLTTGLLSNVVFGGTSYSATSVGDIFTNGNGTSTPTGFGFVTAGDYYSGPDFIDNLSLATTPEPSSLALMLVGGLVLAGFVFRRRMATK